MRKLVYAGALLAVAGSVIVTGPAQALAPQATHYKNCTALNKIYPHGVGKPGAHDKTRSKTGPVTNFTRNAAVYNANKSLDRDHDGIACEKH